MARWSEVRTSVVMAWAAVLSLACPSASGREAKLSICPQKASAEAGTYVLLPPAASLTDGDAAALYDKAIKALPGDAIEAQVQQWLQMPIDKLPEDQAEQVLKQYLESLKCAAQAAKSRQWNRPAGESETEAARLQECRKLASGIRLWARLEISRGAYEGAILALQTGFGMARHMGQVSDTMQFLTGVTIAAGMSREIEPWVQREDAPNLYAALAALPKPFVNAQKPFEAEQADRELYSKFQVLAKRLDRDLACLQCVEAIRSYTASHQGQLPQTLAEITEVSVPKDPMSGEAFRYSRTGATAVLESPALPDGEKREELCYEVTVKS